MSRKVYNNTVEYYNREDKETINWMAVAKIVLGEMTEPYVKPVPYQIKKIAVKDCYTSFITGCRKAKREGKAFELHFRSRKEPKQSCYIPKSALKESGIYPTIAGKLKIKERELLEGVTKDLRLVCEYGRWYLSVPVEVKTTIGCENQASDVVALDPGIRSFLTYFSEDGHFGHLAKGAFTRLLGLHTKLEKLISAKDKETDKLHKRRLYRRIGRIRLKIRDLVDDLHWKCCDFLTRNFKVIILPTFETSDMVKKGEKRVLRKSSVKAMQSFRFYEFSQRLSMKCEERGVLLVRSNEAYTSRTNGFNGELMKIGGRESFRHDGVTVNRDINGARNILIRAMRDSSAEAEMPQSISTMATVW